MDRYFPCHIYLIVTSFLVAEHEQQIDHDSKEVAALVKEQGYIDAKAYKPTIERNTTKEAYVTLVAPACEAGQSDIIIDNVTATFQVESTNAELEFSRKNGEQMVAGNWVDITQTWMKPEEFCTLDANE